MNQNPIVSPSRMSLWRSLLIGLLVWFETVSAADPPPHIVFIIADDLGWSDFGFNSGDMKTPNLDALAYNGIILKRHYSQPLCTPSRAALLTGDYPIRHGMQGLPCLPGVADGLPLGLKLLPEYFRELGYKSHLVGKWHLGFESRDHLPTRRGFDTFFGYLNGYLGYWDGTNYYQGRSGRDMWRDEEPAWSEVYGRYLTQVLTEEAVRLIENHSSNSTGEGGERLLLWLAEVAAHTTYLGMEQEAPISVTNLTHRGILREMVSWLDWSVGEVMTALDRKNMLNNTIIVFISDNGAPSKGEDFQNSGSNWPFRGQKASVHEGGVHTAGLIYSSLLKARSRVSDHLFHITDWLPTLYTAAGGNTTHLRGLDGVDQWSVLESGKPPTREELLVDIDEVDGPEGYLSGKWKLLKNNPLTGGKVPIVDQYSGVSPDWMVYDIASVLNSSVAQVLGGLPQNWTDIRKAAQITGSCKDEAGAMHHDCHSKYCLFNLETDPTECSDIAEANPALVADLSAKLDYYRGFAQPQVPKIYNWKADPSRHHDYWSPWLD